ncbi:MAG TPA: serine/threonine-protein kinase [Kofleriaceae bacterium]|nr:serine/threonine-protein kinase [Kofleriaceae bacterium]
MFVCPECGASQPVPGPCAADRTPVQPIGEDVLLGTAIGAYRVARLLGIGGMGRVYKGVHPTIGSRVAIKVLSRECSDRRDLVERFFAEAKAVNLIRHENIVNVLDLATLPDGRPYIIMEYLDGAPLAAIIEHGVRQQAPLPLGGIARLAAEVLDALGAAHAKGIVHRDLKPDNIFVAPSGRPKVLDFGIAKLSDVTNTSTRTGSLLGTPHYMSPEQAAGRVVDHRADLYAIGVILFECATGRKPFLAEALFDLLRMHVEAPPPPPRALRPDMPPELEQVILTALAKAPDQRFATAMAMSVALQHATAQLPPDQWRPLTPAAVGPGAGWSPTPPASWSGQGSRPPPPPAPSPGNPSTVSAGQVTRKSRPSSSRKGLWIAIAAVVLVGGGITAAVVGGGGGGGSVAVSDKPSKSDGPDKGNKPDKGSQAPPSAPVQDPWAGSAAGAQPAAKAEGQDDADHADHDDGDDEVPAPAKQGPNKAGHAAGGDPMAEALEQLDETIDSLPPDQRKRLAGYKGLSKLPMKERMKKLKELARGQGIALPDIPGAEVPGAEQPPKPASGAWITNHSIDPPAGYDPEHLDVTAFIPWAIAQARAAIPDAQLIRIDTNGVGPDGRANLKLASLASEHGSIDVRFISPSRGKRDPSQPLGVSRHDFKCEFRIMATPEGVEMMPIDFADCSKEHVVPVPRCSFSGVWKKAIKRKAPSANAVGNVDYRSSGSRPVWYFEIGAGFDVAFSEMFGDDC